MKLRVGDYLYVYKLTEDVLFRRQVTSITGKTAKLSDLSLVSVDPVELNGAYTYYTKGAVRVGYILETQELKEKYEFQEFLLALLDKTKYVFPTTIGHLRKLSKENARELDSIIDRAKELLIR